MPDFSNQVNVAQAPAAEGDYASKNPRASKLAGPGGLVAGPAGAIVGRFCWATAPTDGDGSPAVVTNSGVGKPSGFLHREQQALITDYLATSGMKVPTGFALTLMVSGDFWVRNSGATEAVFGQKAYANFADGKITFADSGAPTQGATSSASTIAAKSAVATTATISGNVMTAPAVSGDPWVPGAVVTGTGVAPDTQIVSQLTGTAGGIGTYLVNNSQTVASATLTGTYGLLTIGGSLTGTFGLGQLVTGSGIAASTFITGLGTGVGGAGTYYVNLTQTISSQAINANSNIETKWFARSSGVTGELVKISDHAES